MYKKTYKHTRNSTTQLLNRFVWSLFLWFLCVDLFLCTNMTAFFNLQTLLQCNTITIIYKSENATN